ESLAYWYTGGERPDPAKWGDDLVQADTGEMVIRSRFASEEVVVNFADPALAMMNPNHAYGTVDDCIGYV
ncbi:LLM class flavin-dependent oxidoreductase, partial [Escherichia coli]